MPRKIRVTILNLLILLCKTMADIQVWERGSWGKVVGKSIWFLSLTKRRNSWTTQGLVACLFVGFAYHFPELLQHSLLSGNNFGIASYLCCTGFNVNAWYPAFWQWGLVQIAVLWLVALSNTNILNYLDTFPHKTYHMPLHTVPILAYKAMPLLVSNTPRKIIWVWQDGGTRVALSGTPTDANGLVTCQNREAHM